MWNFRMSPTSSVTVADLNKRRASGRTAATLYGRPAGLEKTEEMILSMLADEFRDRRILDIGVGTGPSTPALLQISRRYVGIDYSPAMIDASRRRFPDLDLEVCDARDLSRFAAGAFDLVVFYGNGIDYVAHVDRLKILAEIRRVCADTGAFVLSTHNLKAVDRIPPIALKPVSPLRPVQMLRRLGGYAVRHVNHLRLKGHEIHRENYAIVNNGSLRELLLHFITPEEQVKQLVQCGFGDVLTISQNGAVRNDFNDCESIWMYYVARKPSIA
jgi:SAM-dependent methyltransferase